MAESGDEAPRRACKPVERVETLSARRRAIPPMAADRATIGNPAAAGDDRPRRGLLQLVNPEILHVFGEQGVTESSLRFTQTERTKRGTGAVKQVTCKGLAAGADRREAFTTEPVSRARPFAGRRGYTYVSRRFVRKVALKDTTSATARP